MDIFGILDMICGLALFLYGMHVMGEGLKRASGGKMESILERLTSNTLMAVLLGAAVTAVIQSSSATTVMVVGFVNSGIMKLAQAAGVIMGANIGTTMTSWILSLAGLEGSNLFIRLLKPTSFTPVLAIVGVALVMFAKAEKKHHIGTVLAGFAVLMTGMTMMSDAVKPLANVPEFTNILLMFTNPILGMIAGFVLTAVIQSSSASVGILQALCITGAVRYSAALPIIMGQNIGTCVTALLSGIGASKNARRASLMHLYFNLIGTIVFMAAFYAINAFMPFAFLNDTANAAGIAVVHTAFNVIATVCWLPFSRVLVWLATLTIPDDKQEEEEEKDNFRLLDDRFLATPGLAVEQCRVVANRMAELTRKAIFEALRVLNEGDYSEDNDNRIRKLEDRIDHYEDNLGTYMVKLSRARLSKQDGQMLSILLHSISDFERISDHAVNIAKAAKEMHEKELKFSESAMAELNVIVGAVEEILKLSIDAFVHHDLDAAYRVEPLEEVIDDLKEQMRTRHIMRLQQGICSIETGFIWSDLLNSLERTSDHCSNIAGCIIDLHNHNMNTHEAIRSAKIDNADFGTRYHAYADKYRLA